MKPTIFEIFPLLTTDIHHCKPLVNLSRVLCRSKFFYYMGEGVNKIILKLKKHFLYRYNLGLKINLVKMYELPLRLVKNLLR